MELGKVKRELAELRVRERLRAEGRDGSAGRRGGGARGGGGGDSGGSSASSSASPVTARRSVRLAEDRVRVTKSSNV